jgi:hypothetical protein
LFHPIKSASTENSKKTRVFASIAIGILTLGASHIAIGLIHKSPEWASRIKASLTGNQAQTAYIINDIATNTLKLDEDTIYRKVCAIENSMNAVDYTKGIEKLNKLNQLINDTDLFEKDLIKTQSNLPIKDEAHEKIIRLQRGVEDLKRLLNSYKALITNTEMTLEEFRAPYITKIILISDSIGSLKENSKPTSPTP